MLANNFPLDQVLAPADTDTLSRFVGNYYYGGYFQPCSWTEYQERQEHMANRLSDGTATISDYQDWVELNWLRPHCARTTGEYLLRKIREEGSEYVPELSSLSPPHLPAGEVDNPRGSVVEMGDSTWPVVASASNAGIDIESTLAQKLKLDKPITLRSLQEEIVNPGNPFWVPLWTDVDLEEVDTVFSDRDGLDPEVLMPLALHNIHLRTARLFGTRHRQDGPEKIADTLIEAADAHADALLLNTYFTGRWSRSSMLQVVRANVAKLSERVTSGQIDKARGNR